MNIKRAKEEIQNTVRAYLAKDAYGSYRIPQLRQRPAHRQPHHDYPGRQGGGDGAHRPSAGPGSKE